MAKESFMEKSSFLLNVQLLLKSRLLNAGNYGASVVDMQHKLTPINILKALLLVKEEADMEMIEID